VGQSCLQANRLHVVVDADGARYLAASAQVAYRSILREGSTSLHLRLRALVRVASSRVNECHVVGTVLLQWLQILIANIVAMGMKRMRRVWSGH